MHRLEYLDLGVFYNLFIWNEKEESYEFQSSDIDFMRPVKISYICSNEKDHPDQEDPYIANEKGEIEE